MTIKSTLAALAVAGIALPGLCDVTSANVVGYQTKTTVAGMNFCTPTFKNMSDAAYSVQDVKLSGDFVTPYVDEIAILDETGNTKEGTSCRWDGEQWVDSTTYEPAEVTIERGEGVVILTLMDGVTVTFSGEVSKADVMIVSLAGMNFVGNAAPVEKDVQTITLTGDLVTPYVDEIAILDETGNTKEGTSCRWDGAQWVDSTTYETAVLTIQPGEGIVILTLMDGVEINLPGVSL